MNSHTLIVPCAAARPEHTSRMPHLFGLAPDDGLMLFIKSITGLDTRRFSRIIFTILADQSQRWDIEQMAQMQIHRLGLSNRAEILTLTEHTRSQAHTVAETCRRKNVTGQVTIKDADSWFKATIPTGQNSVALYRLDALTRVNPQDKSYATVDDLQHVTNIIEKRIIGPWFCAGAYTFADAALFLDTFDALKHHPSLYMSHIIYSLLLSGHLFNPVHVTEYQDWGTPTDLHYALTHNE